MNDNTGNSDGASGFATTVPLPRIEIRNQAKLPKSLSPKMELRLRLLPKIAELRLKKIISAEEELEYLKILTTKKANYDSDDAAERVYHKLKEIERNYKQQKSRKVSTQPKSPRTDKVHEQKETPGSKDLTPNGGIITQTMKLKSGGPQGLNSSTCKQYRLTSSDLQDLFVEMCFYARLRFLQPPCCLYCSYKKSKGSKVAAKDDNRSCRRLVIWREDATKVLCKNKLAGNLLLVQCQHAQNLLRGHSLSTSDSIWSWDPLQQKVIVKVV